MNELTHALRPPYVAGVHELAVHQGIKKPPEEKWITLLDKEGNDKNAEGEAYGDILVRAYLDEVGCAGASNLMLSRLTHEIERCTVSNS